MYVAPLPQGQVVDLKTGEWTPTYQQYMATLTQNMQVSISDDGFVIPSLSQSDMAIVQQNMPVGTLVFNTSEINGGSAGAPNGQLYVKLADGIFHKVMNL